MMDKLKRKNKITLLMLLAVALIFYICTFLFIVK